MAFEASWIPTADGRLDTTGITFRLKILGMRGIGDYFDKRCCLSVLRNLDEARRKRKRRVLLVITCAGVQLIQYPWVSNAYMVTILQQR